MSVSEPIAEADLIAQGAPAGHRVTVLGATGSIGQSTIDLLLRHRDRFAVEALTAHRNAAALARDAIALGARFAAIADESKFAELKSALAGTGIAAGAGDAALMEAAQRPASFVMAAMSGAAGLRPALAAVDRGVTVALANKECLVCAGEIFMQHAARAGATILPVDSEHNALFQALAAGRREDVERMTLTASGGPFRDWTREAIEAATPEQALRHPNWSMGPKITIDSATMMNKGLEIIEAHHLFGLPGEQIEVVVHPQSIIHGMIGFRDGSVIAQLGMPDMRTPIAHCLAWPERIAGPAERLDLAGLGRLTFFAPDRTLFPALRLADRALAAGGGLPAVMNAANEEAVAAFLDRRIGFGGIARLVEAAMDDAERTDTARLPQGAGAEDALRVDHVARKRTVALLPEIAAKAS